MYFTIPLILISFMLRGDGCFGYFRREPKKGTPHPHHPPEKRVPRWWVYQHPQPKEDNLTDAERAYKKMRELQEEKKRSLYYRLVKSMALGMEGINLDGRYLIDERFSGVVESWFLQNLDRLELDTFIGKVPISPSMVDRVTRLMTKCLADTTDCHVQVSSHVHEGDDPDDTDMYFTVLNGIFPTNSTNGVVRVFQIDIARFGKAKNGGPAEVRKVVPLFLDEKPSTDEAWTVNTEYPEVENPVTPEFRDLKMKDAGGTLIVLPFPETLKAMTNFLFDHIDDPLGVRFTEFVGFVTEDGKVSVMHTDTNLYHVLELEAEDDVVDTIGASGLHDEN
jgi:hypothetical protein